MTSMKIVHLPPPWSGYVQNSSTPLDLDVQSQTNTPPPPILLPLPIITNQLKENII